MLGIQKLYHMKNQGFERSKTNQLELQDRFWETVRGFVKPRLEVQASVKEQVIEACKILSRKITQLSAEEMIDPMMDIVLEPVMANAVIERDKKCIWAPPDVIRQMVKVAVDSGFFVFEADGNFYVRFRNVGNGKRITDEILQSPKWVDPNMESIMYIESRIDNDLKNYNTTGLEEE